MTLNEATRLAILLCNYKHLESIGICYKEGKGYWVTTHNSQIEPYMIYHCTSTGILEKHISEYSTKYFNKNNR